jgi:hypothetical protein
MIKNRKPIFYFAFGTAGLLLLLFVMKLITALPYRSEWQFSCTCRTDTESLEEGPQVS